MMMKNKLKSLPVDIKNIYRQENDLWIKFYKKHLKTAVLAISAGIIIGYTFIVANSDKAAKVLNSFPESLISDIYKNEFTVLRLFWKNFIASVLAVLSGRIPFLRLPIFTAFVNGVLLGLGIFVAAHTFGLSLLQYLVTILPHGIFEIPAILFVTCLGLYYNSASHEKRISAHHRRRSVSAIPKNFLESYSEDSAFSGAGEQVALSFIRIAVPLLFIAAFFESSISQRLFKLLAR